MSNYFAVGILSNPVLIAGGILFTLWLLKSLTTPRDLPLPPGPKGYPIIGNLFDMPTERQWLVYDQWFDKYGDIVFFKVLGQPFVILGSLTRTNEIMEKRSSIYSDRIRMPMLVELMGWGFSFAMQPYGSWWRRHRRTFNDHFNQSAVAKYQPIQLQETRGLLLRLLDAPENFMHHIRHTFAATVMDISYGIRIKESDDPYISDAEASLQALAEAGVPGNFLVDLIPILKYVPSWLPGAGFKRKAAAWKALNLRVIQKPFEAVKRRLENGQATECVAATLIDQLPEKGDQKRAEEEEIAEDVSASVFLAGAETTASAIQSFFLAMAIYPEIQKKAQAQIDKVVGKDRLPDFNDRKHLPYINAMVKETLRWKPVTPLAFPHMSTQDDEYDGYLIPKGTLVLGSVWSTLHDPKTYDQPEDYIPDRYLKNGELDPNVKSPDMAYGYGRRICPGRHLSAESLYIIISSVLSVYNIQPPIDDNGNTIKLAGEVTSGVLSFPEPFQCIIKPRSEAAETLIRDLRK